MNMQKLALAIETHIVSDYWTKIKNITALIIIYTVSILFVSSLCSSRVKPGRPSVNWS